MSLSENEKSGPIYSVDVTLVDGFKAATESGNLNGSSKLLSIVRKTVVAGPGIPKARIALSNVGASAGVWQIGMTSSSATDTCVYTVYWQNAYVASPNLPPAGAAANVGVQYAP